MSLISPQRIRLALPTQSDQAFSEKLTARTPFFWRGTDMVGLATKALHEFAGAQEAAFSLDAALAQTGQLTDDYREKLQNLASQLQSTTAIADEKWMAVLTKLTQFGSNEDNIDRDAEAVKNLAGLMEGNLQGAAEAVSRALQGNFMMFSRLGIKIDEHLSQTEKLNLLYTKLAIMGGAQLEARAKTLGGQFDKLENNTSDFLELLGGLIYKFDAVASKIPLINKGMEWLGAKMFGTIPAAEGLKNSQEKVTRSFGDSAEKAAENAKAIDKVADSADKAATRLDKLQAVINRDKSQDEQLDAAEKAIRLAEIDADLGTETISPVAAAKKKLGVEQEFAQRTFRREQVALLQEQTARRMELGLAMKAVGPKEAAMKDADEELRRERARDIGREELKKSGAKDAAASLGKSRTPELEKAAADRKLEFDAAVETANHLRESQAGPIEDRESQNQFNQKRFKLTKRLNAVSGGADVDRARFERQQGAEKIADKEVAGLQAGILKELQAGNKEAVGFLRQVLKELQAGSAQTRAANKQIKDGYNR